MYNRLQLARKYIRYYLTASNGKGHGIHSPFVFDFVASVLNMATKKVEIPEQVEQLRNSLLHNNTFLTVEDFGAGSAIIKSKTRKISHIAHASLKSKKYAILLARIANYYKAQIILELGTSFGITTAYIAAANPMSTIYTIEGDANIGNIAGDNFKKAGLRNIHLIRGNFEDTLPALFSGLPFIDLAFIDGNHSKLPVLNYFNLLLPKSGDNSVLIFDDIHWSKEMEEAWEQIQTHPAVSLTIDLFFMGLVFFNKNFKIPQHFVIRF